MDGTGGPTPPSGSCETLVIDTQLSSPRAAVIATIVVGDLLDVELVNDGGNVVVVVKHHGQIAGGLSAPLLVRLRECMERGVVYRAQVTARRDALVRVRVAVV
jgi:hypothetical protein